MVASGEYLKEKKKDEIFFDRQKKDHYMNHMFYGYDMDRTMLRIGAMNMMTHGIDNPFIEYRDSLSDQNTDITPFFPNSHICKIAYYHLKLISVIEFSVDLILDLFFIARCFMNLELLDRIT